MKRQEFSFQKSTISKAKHCNFFESFNKHSMLSIITFFFVIRIYEYALYYQLFSFKGVSSEQLKMSSIEWACSMCFHYMRLDSNIANNRYNCIEKNLYVNGLFANIELGRGFRDFAFDFRK